jgi:hypothetical protein
MRAMDEFVWHARSAVALGKEDGCPPDWISNRAVLASASTVREIRTIRDQLARDGTAGSSLAVIKVRKYNAPCERDGGEGRTIFIIIRADANIGELMSLIRGDPCSYLSEIIFEGDRADYYFRARGYLFGELESALRDVIPGAQLSRGAQIYRLALEPLERPDDCDIYRATEYEYFARSSSSCVSRATHDYTSDMMKRSLRIATGGTTDLTFPRFNEDDPLCVYLERELHPTTREVDSRTRAIQVTYELANPLRGMRAGSREGSSDGNTPRASVSDESTLRASVSDDDRHAPEESRTTACATPISVWISAHDPIGRIEGAYHSDYCADAESSEALPNISEQEMRGTLRAMGYAINSARGTWERADAKVIAKASEGAQQ